MKAPDKHTDWTYILYQILLSLLNHPDQFFQFQTYQWHHRFWIQKWHNYLVKFRLTVLFHIIQYPLFRFPNIQLNQKRTIIRNYLLFNNKFVAQKRSFLEKAFFCPEILPIMYNEFIYPICKLTSNKKQKTVTQVINWSGLESGLRGWLES